MAGSWPKFIRDPIHNLIRFDDKPLDRLLLKLVDCREFQRLRRIKQLGFAHLVFPAATQTRFNHSLGVMWNARRFIQHLRRLDPNFIDEIQETVVVVGALLHDLGHGPFSHAFEKVTKIKHERRTVEVIMECSTEIHRELSLYGAIPELPCRIASLFPEGLELVRDTCEQYEFPKYLTDVVSSQFDADRTDYLLRDSHACGTEYGRFDLHWLLDHLRVDSSKQLLYLSRKAHHALEEYVFARYHMYQSVYFHKTIRAAEVMLRQVMHRFMQVQSEGLPSLWSPAQDPATPPHLDRVLRGTGNLQDFLLLDDDSLTEFLKSCSASTDVTLAYLARGLLDRHLYKCVDMTHLSRNKPAELGEFRVKVHEVLQANANNLPTSVEYAFPFDEPSDIPYKIYDPDSENPATEIYVELDSGRTDELSRSSGIVDALKKKVSLLRYYFPSEIRSQVEPIVRQCLREDRL